MMRRGPPHLAPRPSTPRTGAWRLAACAVLLAACSAPPPAAPPAPPSPPAIPAGPVPADPYAELWQGRAAAGPVLRIGADALIAVTVRRGGALARLGHDHVVAARRIEGFAAPAVNLAVLRFRLADMTVDDTALREQAGLTTQPSAGAIAGTRHNMLTKVLDAERFPVVDVRVRRGATAAEPVQADITLHGVTRRVAVPTTVAATPGGFLATGTLTLKQTDFGIEPFSVMAGAMAVKDEMELRFAIPAGPSATVPPAPPPTQSPAAALSTPAAPATGPARPAPEAVR